MLIVIIARNNINIAKRNRNHGGSNFEADTVGGDIWGIAHVLQEIYGWTDEEIAGFLGENLARFYRQTWN